MKPLRIHYLQHVPFESPAYIKTWAKENYHTLTSTKLYEEINFTNIEDFDCLIIMGGPMSVYDEEKYDWLKEEKTFIKKVIEANKIVVGICLGSQLIAEVLGAKVYPNKKKEIGWYPVSLTEEGKNNQLLKELPHTFNVMHWHGDTFDLPEGATHLIQTTACPHQSFAYNNNKVLALQFHLEATPTSLKGMIENCGDELIAEQFVQTKEEIIEHIELCKQTNRYLTKILNNLDKE